MLIRRSIYKLLSNIFYYQEIPGPNLTANIWVGKNTKPNHTIYIYALLLLALFIKVSHMTHSFETKMFKSHMVHQCILYLCTLYTTLNMMAPGQVRKDLTIWVRLYTTKQTFSNLVFFIPLEINLHNIDANDNGPGPE